MRRHRTAPARFLPGTLASLLLTGIALAVVSPSASGAEEAVPRLLFPLVAKTDLWDNYGDARGNGRHAGIDMDNPWRAPVVAVEDGRVEFAQSQLGGCMLYLYGRSGTMYLYIHLNNDLTARDDNRGGCVRNVTFAVPNGARVSAGEQVAWNGDSGDASGNPHLHFEVHPSGGADVNPLRHLKRASGRSSSRSPARSSASACAGGSLLRARAPSRSRSSVCATTRVDAGSKSSRGRSS
jgi:murein DD-endopeptidase MepM/ murein hydrolase activator NlpD